MLRPAAPALGIPIAEGFVAAPLKRDAVDGRGMSQDYLNMIDPSCKACARAWPKADHFIADLGLSKAYLHDNQFFPGWTVVVLQRHATELFHLTPTERIQLMEDVTIVAKALAQAYGAKKINYELLGNQLPHIHWHIIPRLGSDPAPLEPVWRVPHEPVLRPPSELPNEIRRIRDAIQCVG